MIVHNTVRQLCFFFPPKKTDGEKNASKKACETGYDTECALFFLERLAKIKS